MLSIYSVLQYLIHTHYIFFKEIVLPFIHFLAESFSKCWTILLNGTVVVRLLFFFHFLVNTSDVLTIESETENRFVLEQLWSSGFLHHTVWLGLYFNIDSKNLSYPSDHRNPLQFNFIKLWPLLSADSLAWVDGSPMDYTNWPNKAPDSKLLTADACVTTRVADGLWHLSQCNERLGFVCKTISG